MNFKERKALLDCVVLLGDLLWENLVQKLVQRENVVSCLWAIKSLLVSN